ncbi:fumarylacetoacetate hydrolase family protein [Pelagibacteraceae bacterium]|jgi:2-keto-4-pentenoate hydratase/2-oxohepta-3-ene-1,7-dioic acid hydratase in catechol pathway|nr:fumarylacetoacetate hydrolase family protein [Pelagibacteraceae bacterium]|tara:strand:- start:560 stop:1447 length:888 start_codon:yes stop_codon:yes gene_type:complete
MHFITFLKNKQTNVGIVESKDTLIDLSFYSPEIPNDLNQIIELNFFEKILNIRKNPKSESVINTKDVKILAPIPVPRRDIMCVGLNYHDHAKEFQRSGYDTNTSKKATPDNPIIFTKATTSVIGPGESIPSKNDPTNTTDYEGELGLIIGKRSRNIKKSDAYNIIFGYTIINDVTARDLQSLHKQWFLGKSPDGFCPMGPAVVTADEIQDVTKLKLTTTINGEVRQNAVVSDLIFDIPTLIETITSTMTLIPGDIIATGTPVGVGIGFNPPKFMKKGDKVTIAISQIGELTNQIS